MLPPAAPARIGSNRANAPGVSERTIADATIAVAQRMAWPRGRLSTVVSPYDSFTGST